MMTPYQLSFPSDSTFCSLSSMSHGWVSTLRHCGCQTLTMKVLYIYVHVHTKLM